MIVIKEVSQVMTCIDAQNLITPFIRGQFDMARLEEFLNHIKECPICMEELDVYYALLTAMQQMDEDKDLSNNYSEDLKMKLKYYEEVIRRGKARRIRKRFYFLFVLVSVVMISSVSFGKSQITQVVPPKPSFLLNYSGIPDDKSKVVALFKEYDFELKRHVAKTTYKRALLYKNSLDYMNKRIYFNEINEETNPLDEG